MVKLGITFFIEIAFLSIIPIANMIKLIRTFRGTSYTLSGRPLDVSEGRDKRLEKKVEEDTIEFHKQAKINGHKIVEIWNPKYVDVRGLHYKNKKAVMLIAPGLDTLDGPAFRWVYKRGVYHIIHNISIKTQILQTIMTSLVPFILYGILEVSFAICLLSTIAMQYMMQVVMHLWTVHRADCFVNKHATTEELKGGMCFLHAAWHEDKKSPLAETILYGIHVPFYASRIKWLMKTLRDRGDSYAPESDRVSKLRELLQKNNQEEQLFIEERKRRVLRWIDADED